MLVGYNTNITYKGNVYHVQTEDSGIKNPYIVTLLYYKGSILSSKKISYAQFAADPDYKKQVRELMKEQHKTMIKELISGKHTEGTLPAKDKDENAGDDQSDTTFRNSLDKQQIAKSLDDILLDYIIKRDN